jgi:hypothetical protein
MKLLFWIGFLGLLLFELANVYFIMPMPGSQQMNSIDLAYFLYKWRWVFRGLFGLMLLIGLLRAKWHRKRKWWLAIPLLILLIVIYMANFNMAADAMFKQPTDFVLLDTNKNKVDSNRLVLGVAMNGEARAYPIRFMGYHHHIQDTIAGKPILVTYCTVCRTGRVYEPIVNGKREKFRLVGMDHFNAMLEDETTGSWWRQVNGEAIAGPRKGQRLPEVFSTQTSLAKWLELHPNSLIMQADSTFIDSYSKTTKYEDGKSRDKLTGTDSLSWNNKSWVIGVKVGTDRKAYDWNQLVANRIIHDQVSSTPLLLVVTADNRGFFALERPSVNARFNLQHDTLVYDNHHYKIDGRGIDTGFSLKPIKAYQEFWHSWRTFNPSTTKY